MVYILLANPYCICCIGLIDEHALLLFMTSFNAIHSKCVNFILILYSFSIIFRRTKFVVMMKV